jgi:hypothetical protein
VTDMRALNLASTRKRSEKALIRRDLMSGELALVDLLADIPQCLYGTNLHDLVKIIPGIGAQRLESLNVMAIREGVNLMVRVERCSERTRRFLAVHLVPSAGRGQTIRYFDREAA